MGPVAARRRSGFARPLTRSPDGPTAGGADGRGLSEGWSSRAGTLPPPRHLTFIRNVLTGSTGSGGKDGCRRYGDRSAEHDGKLGAARLGLAGTLNYATAGASAGKGQVGVA